MWWHWLLYALFTAIGLVALVWAYGMRPLNRWKLAGMPGTHGNWLTGSMFDMVIRGQHEFQVDMMKKYGPIFHCTGWQGPEVVVCSPDLARQVYMTNGNRFPLPGVPDNTMDKTHPGFNQSFIITSRDEKWRSLREAFDPFFLPGSLEAFARQMNESARVLVSRLDAVAGTGELVDMHKLLTDLTMDVIARVSLGVDLHTQDPEYQDEGSRKIQLYAYRMFHTSTATVWFPYIAGFPLFAPLLRNLAQMFPDEKLTLYLDAQRKIADLLQDLLDQHRKKLTEENGKLPNGHLPNGHTPNGKLSSKPSDIVSKAEGSKRRGVAPGSFLDLLVRGHDRKTGKPFTDGTIIRQGHSMLLAGYETTAMTMMTALYNVAKDHEAQEKLAAECARQPENVTLDNIESMPFADAVIKESLRLYPSAPVGGRQAGHDQMLGGYKVPKGMALKVSLWALQRHPDLWERPDEFIPARWLEGSPEAAKRPENAWFAFGAGLRMCPGQRLAMEEIKVAMVHMYRQFKFTLGPGQVPLALKHSMTLAPAKGIWVTVDRRQ